LMAVVALGITVVGCSGNSSHPDGAPDAAACDCRIEPETGVLLMSWDCFCGAFGCRDERLACPPGERADYPECGLTVVAAPGFGPSVSVYDASGTLVGRTISSDTSYYACPTDSALAGPIVRAGQMPAPICREVACGACAPAAFPCAPADGGAGQ
jgi:hypothetical protein